MFVPCDEDGNVFENLDNSIQAPDLEDWKQYKQAKEKVLFDGFEFFDKYENCLNNLLGDFGVSRYGDDFAITIHEKKGYHTYLNIKTIEDLIRIEQGISLTENAIKQLVL